MNDTYQAIYDAFSNSISGAVVRLESLAAIVIEEYRRPFVLYRPKLFLDGNAWCALYGENIQEGVAAFGPTPDAAAWAFDREWAKAAA